MGETSKGGSCVLLLARNFRTLDSEGTVQFGF